MHLDCLINLDMPDYAQAALSDALQGEPYPSAAATGTLLDAQVSKDDASRTKQTASMSNCHISYNRLSLSQLC